MLRVVLLAAACILPFGCARMVVNKDPGPHDKGIRFYRPKPYLFIGPAGAAASASDGSKANEAPAAPEAMSVRRAPGDADDPCKALEDKIDAIAGKLDKALNQKPATLTLQPVLIRIEYLPDYSEEYSIRVTPGLGQANLEVKLENGWNLNAVTATTDQEYDKIIGAVASLASAAGTFGVKTMAAQEIRGAAESNVPLGYYEAVIARNEIGRREMMGWRYVGFMPFNACPVKAQVCRNTVSCYDDDLYALVFVDGTLKMQRMDVVKRGGVMVYEAPPSPAPEESPPAIEHGEMYLPEPMGRRDLHEGEDGPLTAMQE